MKPPPLAPRPRVLLAEDEPNLAKGLVYNLEKRGFDVTHVPRGDTAFETASTEGFDLILLDVMMPGLDGFAVCEKLRQEKILTPILMLTARSEIENRIRGLKTGADDYVGKPFDLEELLMRAEALLRRRHWNETREPPDPSATGADGTAPPAPSLPSLLAIGPVEFDANLLELRGNAQTVALTVIETRLLRLLVEQQGQTLSRAQILKKVWGLREDTQTRTLDNFIMRLRHHLTQVGGSNTWIESVRGVGYRFSVRA